MTDGLVWLPAPDSSVGIEHLTRDSGAKVLMTVWSVREECDSQTVVRYMAADSSFGRAPD